jgi:ATP-dependent RNA helicase DeaD
VLVLDEADEMLDMGFAEDLDAILEATPKTRQTALFSATMPARILSIAERHLKNPARGDDSRARRPPPASCRASGSSPTSCRARTSRPRSNRVLEMEDPASALVFCRTRLEVETVVEALKAHGHRAEALHGGMEQRQRDRVMQLFRSAKVELLVATDVAARGLDIDTPVARRQLRRPDVSGSLRPSHRPHGPHRPRRRAILARRSALSRGTCR